MRRLNKARVALKHNGVMPSHQDLEDFASTASHFFEQSTPLVFGISFDSISLVDFITYEPVRTALQRANTALEAGDLESSLEACAEAFYDLMQDYEGRKQDRFRKLPFSFGTSRRFHSSFEKDRISGNNAELRRWIDQVEESIEAIQGAVKVLGLGLDYRRYSRFRHLTPRVREFASGRRDFFWGLMGSGRRTDASRNDLSFCIDFVIESALQLQEFGLEY
jgi:hypothetical protein